MSHSAGQKRFHAEWLALSLLALVTVILLVTRQWSAPLGNVIYDRLVQWHPPEPSSQIIVVQIDDHTLEQLGGWPLSRAHYARLLQKLADSGNHPRAIGIDLLFYEPTAQDAELARQLQRHRAYLAAELQPTGQGATLKPPVPTLAAAASALAHISLSFDPDGFLRGTQLQVGDIPHLTVAMSAGTAALPQPAHTSSYRRFKLVEPGRGFPSVSLADALSGRLPPGLFKDKYLLIGSTAPSLGDHYPTIYSGQVHSGLPGVELHANLLNGILQNQLVTIAAPA